MENLTDSVLTEQLKKYDFGYDLDLISVDKWEKVSDNNYKTIAYLERNTSSSSQPIPAQVELIFDNKKPAIKVKIRS